jgi:hypothetical protein
MKPLRVALVHREAESMLNRTYGPWSYQVPEFEVEHYPFTGKDLVLDRARFAGHDLIVQEDGRLWIEWHGNGPPLVYVVTDSTLSEQHYRDRYQQAAYADLTLVDWDRLERFEGEGRRVARCSYSVNDRLFYDRGVARTVDVGVHMNFNAPERREMVAFLEESCRRHSWVLDVGTYNRERYAEAFSLSKIVVNLERTLTTRAHRVNDVMASGACLLTTPLPDVPGEERQAGWHYREWRGLADLERQIDALLTTGEWEQVAQAGHELVHRAHTWTVRARQLRALLGQVFPALEGVLCLSN